MFIKSDFWLIGVVGKDLLLEDLLDEKGLLTREDIIELLLDKSSKVKNSQVIEPCELQVHLP